MKQYKWLNKRLITGVLVSVILAVTASVGLSTSPMVSASNPPPETEWEKTFGGIYSDYSESVQQATDGGYILAGATNSYGAGQSDAYLVKTDAMGNAEWEKTFGGSNHDHAYAVQQTTDGGYILAGYTSSYGAGGRDVYLVKTDAAGNAEWEKTFGGSSADSAYSAQQTADGGYVMAGYTESYGAGSLDVYLVKADAAGNIEWEKTFGGSTYDFCESVQQTADGGYIIAGATQSYTENWYYAYLVKTDAAGNTEWEKTFGGSGWDEAFSARQTTDGGYIIAGFTDSYGAGGGDIYLVKTDAVGNIEWEKAIGGSYEDYAYRVRQTTDGGYILAGGTSSYGAGQSDVYLVKVSSLINTPVGSDVTVSLESAAVTFPDVQESGTTTATTLTENPADPTPSDFYVIAGNFVEITTTAIYSGLVTVGIRYDESQVSNEESLVLFHWSGSEWEDITTYVDTVENIVYGEADSLSLFFIGEPVVLPVADAGGPYLVQVDCSVDLDGSASYHPDGTIVSYDWNFGDNTTGSGVLVSHTYTAVGIYEVNLTVTDDSGVQASDTTMVVVYDPDTGSATGGGWFWSAPGNLKQDPESEGKATFGFVVKYKHETAGGNLEFQYHVGDINLKSSDITWLMVSGANAQFQGEGTINGDGLYTFRVLAKDGDKAGGQPDEFTIRIWQGIDTEADPIYQAINAQLGGGNIIIHNN